MGFIRSCFIGSPWDPFPVGKISDAPEFINGAFYDIIMQKK
jgi:hypothetical protein